MRVLRTFVGVLLLDHLSGAPLALPQEPRGAFELVFDAGVFPQPFQGDVLVAFATTGEPRKWVVKINNHLYAGYQQVGI